MNRLVRKLRNTRSYQDGATKPKKSRRSTLSSLTELELETPPSPSSAVGPGQRKSSLMRMSVGSVDPGVDVPRERPERDGDAVDLFTDSAREEGDSSSAADSPAMLRRNPTSPTGVSLMAYDTDHEAELRDKTRMIFDSLRLPCPGGADAVPIDTIQSAMLNAEVPFTQQELNVLFQGTNLKHETRGFMTHAEFHEMSIYAYCGQLVSELRSVKLQNVGFGEATDA